MASLFRFKRAFAFMAMLALITVGVVSIAPTFASNSPVNRSQTQVHDAVPPPEMCNVVDSSGNVIAEIPCPSAEPGTKPSPVTGVLDTSCVGDPKTVAEPHHMVRLQILDPVFRSGGMLAWMQAADFTWDAKPDARQPLEESYDLDGDDMPDVNYVSGFQIIATNVVVNWPNAVTTDTPSRITWKEGFSEQLLVAENTGSTIYTNVVADGPVTIYADATNWGQLASILGCDNTTVVDGVTSNPPSRTAQPQNPSTGEVTGDWCLSEKELQRKYGIARETIMDARNGILFDPPAHKVPAGALLRLNKGNPYELSKHGWYVAGDKSTGYLPAWNPPSCRPMELLAS